MTNLEKLCSAKDIRDIASLINFQPKYLAYILYEIPVAKKYTEFTIPKKSGGTRIISKPEPRLMLIQKRLAKLLLACVNEIEEAEPQRRSVSHAFHKGRSVITNASQHTGRRYVLNVDIEDFFGTIHFGRVRGFFMNDRHFKLAPKAATILAQIACHNNALPQGSPCSPIITNLIGHIMDVGLSRLAKRHKLSYSRYADDLTFSTNRKNFPKKIAKRRLLSSHLWVAGKELKKEIKRCGFSLNNTKTRLQIRGSRQDITGLVVNVKPNIRQEYYRLVRAMCHSLFTTGAYTNPHAKKPPEDGVFTSLAPLEGMLAHIDYVKKRRNIHGKTRKDLNELPEAPTNLFEKLLFFKYFIVNEKPLIVTEGKTDVTYLRAAIKSLNASYPTLYETEKYKIQFFKRSHTKREVLGIGEGVSSFNHFITNYKRLSRRYKHRPVQNPVILLIDNDDGFDKALRKTVSAKSGITVDHATDEKFYYLGENLYLIKTAANGNNHTAIEDCFDTATLTQTVDGKPLNLKKLHGDEASYGKEIFAKRVVAAKYQTIDFTGFSELLDRIVAAINDYESRKSANTAS